MGITQIKRCEAGTSQPTLDAIRNLARTPRVSADELLFGTPLELIRRLNQRPEGTIERAKIVRSRMAPVHSVAGAPARPRSAESFDCLPAGGKPGACRLPLT